MQRAQEIPGPHLHKKQPCARTSVSIPPAFPNVQHPVLLKLHSAFRPLPRPCALLTQERPWVQMARWAVDYAFWMYCTIFGCTIFILQALVSQAWAWA